MYDSLGKEDYSRLLHYRLVIHDSGLGFFQTASAFRDIGSDAHRIDPQDHLHNPYSDRTDIFTWRRFLIVAIRTLPGRRQELSF